MASRQTDRQTYITIWIAVFHLWEWHGDIHFCLDVLLHYTLFGNIMNLSPAQIPPPIAWQECEFGKLINTSLKEPSVPFVDSFNTAATRRLGWKEGVHKVLHTFSMQETERFCRRPKTRMRANDGSSRIVLLLSFCALNGRWRQNDNNRANEETSSHKSGSDVKTASTSTSFAAIHPKSGTVLDQLSVVVSANTTRNPIQRRSTWTDWSPMDRFDVNFRRSIAIFISRWLDWCIT